MRDSSDVRKININRIRTLMWRGGEFTKLSVAKATGFSVATSNKLLNDYENIIIVKSLTKFFAIPGARIGYGLCSNKEIMDKINKILVPWSINVIAAEGITKGLTEKQYIKKSIEYIEDEKEYLWMA